MTGSVLRFLIALALWAPLWSAGTIVAADGPAAPGTAADATEQVGRTMKDIHDIRPPVSVGSELPWAWIIPGVAGALLLAAAIAWWIRRRRKSGRMETVGAEILPEAAALQALSGLSDVRTANPKVFYFRLSAVIRKYIYDRFGMGAPEMTTEEFVFRIDELGIDAALCRQLKSLTRGSDPVKFGGEPAEPDRMADDLAIAIAFVEKTTPVKERAKTSKPALKKMD